MLKHSNIDLHFKPVLPIWIIKTPALFVFLLLLFLSLACGSSSSLIGSGQNKLTIINGADGSLCSIRIKKASSQTFWGANLLTASQSVAPGDSFVIENLAAGRYDLDAHLCDDNGHPGFGRYDLAVGDNLAPVWVVGQVSTGE